jgi:hypothetical protein
MTRDTIRARTRPTGNRTAGAIVEQAQLQLARLDGAIAALRQLY